jgi:hypothetical protein
MGDLTAAEESDACITACDGPGAEFEREEVWVTPDSSRMPHCKVCKTQGCMHFRRGFAHLLALNQVRTRPRVLCGCGLRAPQCSKARCVATGFSMCRVSTLRTLLHVACDHPLQMGVNASLDNRPAAVRVQAEPIGWHWIVLF